MHTCGLGDLRRILLGPRNHVGKLIGGGVRSIGRVERLTTHGARAVQFQPWHDAGFVEKVLENY